MPKAKKSNEKVDSVKAAYETAAKKAKKATNSAIKTAKDVSDTAVKTAKEVSDSAINIAKEISTNTVEKVKKPFSGDVLSERKICIQYYDKQVDEEDLVLKFKEIWLKEHKLSEIKELKAYYKIEDQKAYFVVNGSTTVIAELF